MNSVLQKDPGNDVNVLAVVPVLDMAKHRERAIRVSSLDREEGADRPADSKGVRCP